MHETDLTALISRGCEEFPRHRSKMLSQKFYMYAIPEHLIINNTFAGLGIVGRIWCFSILVL